MSKPLTPIPTKTIKRAHDEGRVVITLEVKVSSERMAQAPSWQRDATDILREVLDSEIDFTPLAMVLQHFGIEVLTTDARAGK